MRFVQLFHGNPQVRSLNMQHLAKNYSHSLKEKAFILEPFQEFSLALGIPFSLLPLFTEQIKIPN